MITSILSISFIALVIIRTGIEEVKKANSKAFLHKVKEDFHKNKSHKERQKQALNSVQIFVNKNSLTYLRSEYQQIPPDARDSKRAKELRGKIKAMGGKMWAIDENNTISYY